MGSQYYKLEIDVRVVIMSTTEIIIQKMNSMSMDSKCVILKSERCIELIKYLLDTHTYFEIKQYFKTDIPNLNDIIMTLIKHNMLSIGKINVVL